MQEIQILGQIKSINGDLNDIIIDSSGNVQLISQEDLARQNIIKILMTNKGQNFLLPSYGTILSSLIGKKLTDVTQSAISSEIVFALSYLVSLFPSSLPFTLPQEVINTLQSLDLIQDPSDPRSFFVRVKVLLDSGGNVSLIVKG